MSTTKTCLVIGSGAFGLSMVHELLQRGRFKETSIVLISPTVPSADGKLKLRSRQRLELWKTDADLTASRDTTRIVRADYADPAYALLAREAQELWRGEWGANGRYNESGLLLTGDEGTRGAEYVIKSLENVKQSIDAPAVQETSQSEGIGKAMGLSDSQAGTGDLGYLNRRSGWADAGASMDWLYREILNVSAGRLRVISEAARRLIVTDDGERISGCETESGELVLGDFTILATGAWTPSLIDLRGIATATGQSMLYVNITEDEATRLKSMPVHVNLTSGCFVFPPTKKADESWEVKVARHAYGVVNPTAIPIPVGRRDKRSDFVTASIPAFPARLPAEDERMLRNFLRTALPSLNKVSIEKRDARGRMCWYLDTCSGDFLGCWHPSHPSSLFLATGGSGHAFKFLPALGKRLVDVLDETDGRARGGEWTRKWQFPQPSEQDGKLVELISCEDGSRGGEPGRILQQILNDSSFKVLNSRL